MSKVLIFGATGLLGSSLHLFLEGKGHAIYTAGRSESSSILFSGVITSDHFYEDVARLSPDIIINLIAATNVDQCEQTPEIAYELNSDITKAVCNASLECKINHAHVIHISSDQVYSGVGPHSEDTPDPCNIYGLTKLSGEKWVVETGGTVLRTNFVGASLRQGRDGFTDWLYKSALTETPIKVFRDVLFSPGHISDVCDAIATIIDNRQKGVFNFGSRDAISKANFSFHFLSGLGLPLNLVEEASMNQLNFLAKRPNDMSMNVALFEKSFNRQCPDIDKVINTCIQEYK